MKKQSILRSSAHLQSNLIALILGSQLLLLLSGVSLLWALGVNRFGWYGLFSGLFYFISVYLVYLYFTRHKLMEWQ